jgi:hypothetical protein
MDTNSVAKKQGPLRNRGIKNQPEKAHQSKECDPRAAAAAPGDIGILRCAERQYCKESSDSSLGGICVDRVPVTTKRAGRTNTKKSLQKAVLANHRRNLQTTVDGFEAIAEYFCSNGNYTCASCNYGEGIELQDFTCSLANPSCEEGYFTDFCGNGNTDYCFNYIFSGTSSPTERSLTFCDERVSPAQFTMCSTLSPAEDGGYACSYSVNGVGCSSCEVVPDEDDPESNCLVVNCENTDVAFVGNTCDSDALKPFRTRELYQALVPCEGGCSICAEDELMAFLDVNVTAVPGSTDEVSCEALQIIAWTGYDLFSDPATCTALNPVVSETCGCYRAEDGRPDLATTAPEMEAPVAAPSAEAPEDFFSFAQYICSGGSPYSCSACDLDPLSRSGTFECIVPKACRDVGSFCESPMNFCFYDTLTGEVSEDNSYSYKFCSSIESENNDTFTYCVDISVLPENMYECTFEVDGIQCNSCVASGRYTHEYDCKNTVLGRNGTFPRADERNLILETEEYFVYTNLPCPEGCNLCGGNAMMTQPETTFDTGDGTASICFQSQFEALVGPTMDSACQELQSSVREPCGCQERSTPAPTASDSTPPPVGSAGARPLVWKTLATAIAVGVSAFVMCEI